MNIKQLYIEPTSHCNLQCEMCSRKHWQNESIGHMEIGRFNKLIDEIPDSIERIFFGGVGEPLTHPDILHMVRRAAQTGRRVEMVTNGMLLCGEMPEALVDAGLDMLWVSIDALDEDNYAAIRKGGALGDVLGNIQAFNTARWHLTQLDSHVAVLKETKSFLGVAFVLMRKNLPDFRRLLELAPKLGIDEIRATHLLPYDAEQEDEVLYRKILDNALYREKAPHRMHIDLPLMAPNDLAALGLGQAIARGDTLSVMNEPLLRKAGHCRFIDDGYVFVRWDGAVCPCMALLHDNQVYQNGRTRQIRHSGYGNIAQASLQALWDADEFAAFRARVADFTFSPCASCGSCDLFENNNEDCFGNPFPTCGGCLWAQGLFQCP